MKAQCECGHRHRVTSAHSGKIIRCVCGTSFEVPSLRQLKTLAAENVIVDIFEDPGYWSSIGCFICKANTDEKFWVRVQLQAAAYRNVAVGPQRRGMPIIQTVLGVIFGAGARLAVAAADAMTEKTERRLVQPEKSIEFPLRTCKSCAAKDEIQAQLAQELIFHALYVEMKEDYPDIRITSIIDVNKIVTVEREFCSTCNTEVVPDEDARCPGCKWPI